MFSTALHNMMQYVDSETSVYWTLAGQMSEDINYITVEVYYNPFLFL
jgi:hypothetical protein